MRKSFGYAICLFWVFLTAASAQDYTVKINAGDYYFALPARQIDRVYYVHADSIGARLFSDYRRTGNSIEFLSVTHTMTVKAGNPFITLFNLKHAEEEIRQIPIMPLMLGDGIYLPLEQMKDMLRMVIGRKLSTEYSKRGNDPVVTDHQEVDETPTPVAGANTLLGFQLDRKKNGTIVNLGFKQPVKEFKHKLFGNTLKVRLYGVTINTKEVDNSYDEGVIALVIAENFDGYSEIHFTLRSNFRSYDLIKTKKGGLMITLHNDKFSELNEDKKKTKKFSTVIIDPGHGGKDHGALGLNGEREKEINLAVALRLGEMIEKNLPGVHVVYTRKSDKFIELYKRGKIANQNDGSLFISLHCNSTPKKPSDAEGFEIYLLRPGKTDEAIRIAETENSVISYEDDPSRYQELTDENFILVSMQHASYMQFSEKFSLMLDQSLSRVTGLKSRGVKQAGFLVLVGVAMPAVLIEKGFISNPDEARYINSSKGKDELATAIFEAVKTYKQYYDAEFAKQ